MKYNLKSKLITGILSFAMIAISTPAYGQTSTSTLTIQIQSLLAQIQNLQAQLRDLDTQRGAVVSDLANTIRLTRQLAVGASGDEVTTLQEILATDKDVYPEGLVTGFFGPLTQKAVLRFQQKHGVESVGEVGPKTRSALLQFASGLRASTTAMLPPGLQKKLAIGISTTTPVLPENTGATITICHRPPGNPNNGQTITIGVSAWFAHSNHGDTIGACGNSVPQPVATSTDNTAPIISAITSSANSSTTANVSWTTNEPATGTFWYGTSTPLNLDYAVKLKNESLQTYHSVGISGLAATTTYHFLISSSDASGNTATSSESSFTTPDTP